MNSNRLALLLSIIVVWFILVIAILLIPFSGYVMSSSNNYAPSISIGY